MATQFEIDCALMAGAAYRSTRNEKNRFPSPTGNGWGEIPSSHIDIVSSGFEAVSFKRGDEIVISFAGTYPGQNGDLLADAQLGAGSYSVSFR